MVMGRAREGTHTGKGCTGTRVVACMGLGLRNKDMGSPLPLEQTSWGWNRQPPATGALCLALDSLSIFLG